MKKIVSFLIIVSLFFIVVTPSGIASYPTKDFYYTQWNAITETETTGIFCHGIELPPQSRPSIPSGTETTLYVDEWLAEGTSIVLSTYFYNGSKSGFLGVFQGPQQIRFNYKNGERFYTKSKYALRFFRFRFWFGIENSYYQVKFQVPSKWYWSEQQEKQGIYNPPAEEKDEESKIGTLANAFKNNPNFHDLRSDSRIYSIRSYPQSNRRVSIFVSYSDQRQGGIPYLTVQVGSSNYNIPCVWESRQSWLLIIDMDSEGIYKQAINEAWKDLKSKYGLNFGYSIGVSYTPPN
jgi:hypothetical protein